jgi:thiol-disulfide isomerase/thioredoxin
LPAPHDRASCCRADRRGRPRPVGAGSDIVGTVFDGAPVRPRPQAPVVVNFWGPSCVPCRNEFPLLEAKQARHAADGLTVVGVLTDDPVEPARDFVTQYGADWATVIDPDKAIKAAYRVAGRPQTYFVDSTASSGPSRSVS